MATLVAPLQKFLDWLQRERIHRDGKVEEAIVAVAKALSASQNYLEATSGRRGVDRDKELEIATLWSIASAKARSAYVKNHEGKALSIQFADKAEWWRSRLEWPEEKISETRIAFSEIEKSLKLLSTTI